MRSVPSRSSRKTARRPGPRAIAWRVPASGGQEARRIEAGPQSMGEASPRAGGPSSRRGRSGAGPRGVAGQETPEATSPSVWPAGAAHWLSSVDHIPRTLDSPGRFEETIPLEGVSSGHAGALRPLIPLGEPLLPSSPRRRVPLPSLQRAFVTISWSASSPPRRSSGARQTMRIPQEIRTTSAQPDSHSRIFRPWGHYSRRGAGPVGAGKSPCPTRTWSALERSRKKLTQCRDGTRAETTVLPERTTMQRKLSWGG